MSNVAEEIRNIRRNFGLIAGVWTLLSVASFVWMVFEKHNEIDRLAKIEAESLIREIVSFRVWVASHGGVYVPTTERTPPNPYLAGRNEDVLMHSGQRVTLMNPAYVTRQVLESDFKSFGVRGHLTSLKPLNPGNKPQPWEERALQSFEQGAREASQTSEIDGAKYFSLMQALTVEPACLKCHSEQGYKVGDVRGGLRVTLPLAPYLESERRANITMGIIHGGTWLLVLLASLPFYRGAMRRAVERDQAERELAASRNLMFHQARLAAMGEMIGNIAHQWRQPLNTVGLVIQNILFDYRDGTLTDETLTRHVGNGLGVVERMSKTIDDFRTFFRPDRQPEEFLLGNAIEQALNLVQEGLAGNGIAVDYRKGADIRVRGFPNELSQVILNLLSNAKDAILANGIKSGTITIDCRKVGALATITVTDNGGGIAEDIMPRLFDPYVTSKAKGTGIGLYMSKMIMGHMGGRIAARNAGAGAEFTLELPGSDDNV